MLPAPLLILLCSAAAAPGFDCARAAAPDERIICTNEGLAAQDHRLAVLYSWALAVPETVPGRAALKRDQVAWLKRRRACGKEAGAAACIEALYRARLAALERLLPEGCPDAVLTDRHQAAPGANGCEERSASWPELDAATPPKAAAFNAFYRRGWSEACVPSTEPPDPEAFSGQFAPGVPGSNELSYVIAWATPRFVTVVFQEFQFGAGAAHPNTRYIASTFDLERGRSITPEDFLVSGPKARGELAEKILRRLDKDRLDEETTTRTVEGIIGDPGVWILDGKGATIRFPRYSVAPYAAGDLEVRLTWKELGPWLLPGGLMPPGR
jgi:uncharacterized protein